MLNTLFVIIVYAWVAGMALLPIVALVLIWNAGQRSRRPRSRAS